MGRRPGVVPVSQRPALFEPGLSCQRQPSPALTVSPASLPMPATHLTSTRLSPASSRHLSCPFSQRSSFLFLSFSILLSLKLSVSFLFFSLPVCPFFFSFSFLLLSFFSSLSHQRLSLGFACSETKKSLGKTSRQCRPIWQQQVFASSMHARQVAGLQ